MQDTSGKVGIRELLEAGVHFGHQAKRWNPKMKKFIFAERAGVHIIDLDQTLDLLDKSLDFVRSVAEANRDVLFVGTKKQAQITVAEEAIRSGQPYVAERYIGGMLTNFQTIQPRIEYFKELSARIEETPEEDRSGKDWFALSKEYQKLRRNFAGLTEMARLPGALFIVDPKREELLVKEANRLKIPVVALTDSNCDPEVVDYVIPGNDDAIRAISLISRLIADAVLSGRGEDIVPAEDRPVPPVVEEAKAAEEEAEVRAAQPKETATANGAAESAPAASAEANGNGASETPSVGTIGAVASTPAPADAEAEAQIEAEEDAEAEEEAEAVSDAPSEDTEEDAEAETVAEAPSEDAEEEAEAETVADASLEEAPAEDVSDETPSEIASSETPSEDDAAEAASDEEVSDEEVSDEDISEEGISDETPSDEDVSVEVSAEDAVEEEAEAKSGEVVEPEEASGHPEDTADEEDSDEEDSDEEDSDEDGADEEDSDGENEKEEKQ